MTTLITAAKETNNSRELVKILYFHQLTAIIYIPDCSILALRKEKGVKGVEGEGRICVMEQCNGNCQCLTVSNVIYYNVNICNKYLLKVMQDFLFSLLFLVCCNDIRFSFVLLVLKT